MTAATRALLDGSDLPLECRGAYTMKGLSGSRTVFALRRPPP